MPASMRHRVGMNTTHHLLAVCALGLVACDAGSLAAIGTQKDAKAGFDALLQALGGADTARSGAIVPPRGFREGEAWGDGVHELVDVIVPCSEGGQLVLSGTLEIAGLDAWTDLDPGGIDPGALPGALPSVTFEYSVDFDACEEGGVTIDGAIDWSMASVVDAATYAASFDWSYAGTVTFSGAATGECALDLHGLGDGEIGTWQGVDPAAFDGEVCGYAAAETLGE